MTSRAAVPPRVTGGRPATMTRSAVQQARTQARPSTPTTALEGLETQVDGWVSVDHHRRKHKQGPLPTTGKKNDERNRELRRTQSAVDATADKDEPPVARPNARADALSAAVTMDKKARERSYYASPSGATSPPAALMLNATWGSPPPPPGFMSRSKSTSPDSAALQLERASSLQKLMSAWQVAEGGKEQPGNPRNATRATKPSRNEAQVIPGYDFDVPPPELNLQLRRAQSDVLPQTVVSVNTRQRSPTGRNQGASNEGKTPNGNNANASNTNGNPKKCGDKRDFFFRNLNFETRSLLQIDEVASFSVTDFEMAKKISMAIVDLFPAMKEAYAAAEAADAYYYGSEAPLGQRKYPLVITDATACVGGNVISFCDFFQFVYAIENDATRVSMLEHNLRVLQKFNVSCRCASYLDVMYDYHQDVIFFDPPWGGPEYKDQDKVDLYLDEQPLYEICESLQGYAQVIVLKVPTNFDDEKFAYCVSGRVTVRKDFKKMHLVVLDFR